MLTTNQRRALTLLANATYGCTVPYMLSHGCTVAALRHLARSRLTITDRVREPGKPGTLTVVRLRISNSGLEGAGAIGSGCRKLLALYAAILACMPPRALLTRL
jgi:hypothetical protein